MRRRVMLVAGLLVVGGLGIVAAASEGCDLGAVPEPVPVLALEGGPLTLLAAETLPGPGDGAADTHPCEGKLRPGVKAIFNNSYRCTLNWVYRDNAGALYIGTAGHCAPNYNPRVISAAGIADIGEVAFTTGNSGVGNDFALIRIDPAYYSYVDPTLCHWGGPGGVHGSGGNQGLLHYGHGVFWGESPETRSRAGLVRNNGWSPGAITFTGAVSGGDSGSPIMVSDGGAAGVITHTASLAFPHFGTQYANRVDSGLARANAAQPARGYALLPSNVPVDLTGLLVPE